MSHSLHEPGFAWLFNAAPDAMLVADREGRLVAANPMAEALFRLPQADLLKRSVDDLVPSRFRAGHARLRDRWHTHPARREMGTALACVGQRADGVEFPADISLSPLWEVSSGMVLIAIRDVSERRRAESQVYRERERALVTLASISDAVITTDADGIIDYLNPSAERLTGWSGSRVIGAPIDTVFTIAGDETDALPEHPVGVCLKECRILASDQGSLRQADGYLLPVAFNIAPIRSAEGRTTGMVVVFRDIVQQRRLSRRLSYEATHDALTKLINRQEFDRRLTHVAHAARETAPATLCYFDLDRFKAVNDGSGHLAGDAVLRQVAGIMTDAVRQRDSVARLGGDEFAVLLENCGIDEGVQVAAKIQRLITGHCFGWQEQSFRVGVSAGVVAIYPGATPEEILVAADGACYASKARGGKEPIVATTATAAAEALSAL